jgi:DNA-binding transcriptional MerR regulator
MEYGPWSSKISTFFMLIGELAVKTGLSRDTIRFYEKQGLIQVGRKERRVNNYKEYPEWMVGRLMTIKRMKNTGFTLNEVADLLEMIEINVATCAHVSGLIEKKVRVLEGKIQEMIAFRNQLTERMSRCRDSCMPTVPEENCPILVGDDYSFG